MIEVESNRKGPAAGAISQEGLRVIVERALDAIIAMDHRGAIIEWNTAASALLGWRRDEILGSTLAEVIIPERYRLAHATGLAHFLVDCLSNGHTTAKLGEDAVH